MRLRSTSPCLWIRMTRDPFPMTRTTRVNIRSQQLSTRSSDKLWLHQRDRLSQPAKTKRVSRASLLDLGGLEVTDTLRQSERPGRLCWTWAVWRWLTVSWLDQPSLQDTMVFYGTHSPRAERWQEVEKTTLSEIWNTASSTFKFFTVKQIFPRELSQGSSWCPLRAQASWWPRIQRQQGPFLPTKCHIGCV